MAYKLLAVDVDGTLLRRDGTIHPDDAVAIDRLQQSGVPVTIATGRLYSGTAHIARNVKLNGPIACVDGSHIADLRDDSSFVYQSIRGEHAVALRGVLEQYRAASFLFTHDNIVHDELGEPFASYVRTWSPNVDRVEDLKAHPYWEHELGLMAVVAVGLEDDISRAKDALSERLAHAAFVLHFPLTRLAGVSAMLVRAAGPTKGTAVEWLAQHHGCTAAEVVAIGDWLNDIPMFQTAGRSFAMKQAPEAVKEAATDTLDVDAHTGGGVAAVIRRIWGL